MKQSDKITIDEQLHKDIISVLMYIYDTLNDIENLYCQVEGDTFELVDNVLRRSGVVK